MKQPRTLDELCYSPVDEWSDLSIKIGCWAQDTGLLDKPNPQKQIVKLMEGLTQIASGINTGHPEQATEAIGRIFIALNVLAQQLGTNVSDCGYKAWEELERTEYPPPPLAAGFGPQEPGASS